LDIDEFVNVQVGDRTIPALLAALPGATAVAPVWRMFGHAGVSGIADIPVTRQFTRAARAALALARGRSRRSFAATGPLPASASTAPARPTPRG
jgi:hypothetical protein